MTYFIMITVIAGVFFVLIPGAGALQVRRRWRTFRQRLYEAADSPPIEIGLRLAAEPGFVGRFGFFGSLEAIQGDDIVWLKGDRVTVAAHVGRTEVYEMPPYAGAEQQRPERPVVVPWKRIGSLPQGTRFFVHGSVASHDGRLVFESTKTNPLLVIMYDGPKAALLRRALWSGRHRNEYWNAYTPVSLLAGLLVEAIVAVLLFANPGTRMLAITALVAGLIPVLPVVPPGLLFFYVYRYLWRQGRHHRAQRDLVALPMVLHLQPVDSTPQALRQVAPITTAQISQLVADGATVLQPPWVGRRPTALSVVAIGLGAAVGPESQWELLIYPTDATRSVTRFRWSAAAFEVLSMVAFLSGLTINVWIVARLLVAILV